MTDLTSRLAVFAVSALVTVLVVAVLYAVHCKLLALYSGKPAKHYRRQLIMLGLSLVALVLVIFVIPVSDALQGQMLALLGILLSATIALASTTIVGNTLAGLVLKSQSKIQAGRYIRVGEHYGRVSAADLFHTEIQTEDRDLITLPNLYLVMHPVTVMPSSGAIISVDMSLGYDMPRSQVEKLLIKTATDAGLGDPLVQIRELGQTSVTYRIAGLAEDLSRLPAIRRQLRAQALDALQKNGVAMVAPPVINTLDVDRQARSRPDAGGAAPAEPEVRAEKTSEVTAIDKTVVTESLETLHQQQSELNQRIEEIDAALKGMEDDKDRRKAIFEKKKALATLARLEKQIYSAKSKAAAG
jgi:small conductance mechanosensitive channel